MFLHKPIDYKLARSKKYRAMNKSTHDYTKNLNFKSSMDKLDKSNDQSTKTRKSYNSE